MGRKNARARQARLQRKRNKRAASRSGGPSNAGGIPKDMMAQGIILCCQMLFAGEPLSDEPMELARVAKAEEGGALGRIPLELHGFLFEGKPWLLTCSELAPLKRVFDRGNADEVFERLWSLALTNESGRPERFDEDLDQQECAHRAASAFESLRGCLDDRKRSADAALRLIGVEASRHGNSARLVKGYEKLLRTALATVRATPGKLPAQLTKFALQANTVFEQAARERATEAWSECGVVFLKEVLRRLAVLPQVAGSSAYAALVRRLLDGPQAALELALSGQAEALAKVQLGDEAALWSRFLERTLDVGALPFDERVRYQIARLKLLKHQAMNSQGDEDWEAQALKTFQALQSLLSHGVPPASRAIPAALAAPLQDFYVDMLEALRCEAQAMRVTEEQLRAHPHDFRLACLFATGALQNGESFRLSFLGQCSPVRHVSAELFARSVRLWSRTPQGGLVTDTLRQRLFDPLNHEDRKQCLIALSKQCVRRAGDQREYDRELASVLPYFPADSFVLAELREQTALESSLVFLATMMAPLHHLELTLTDEQSQQWVSYAREIARQSRVCSELVLRYLRRPFKGFTLAPAVLESARDHIADFKQQPETAQAARPPAPPKPAKRRRRKKDAIPGQQELF